jgi:hypothetical protein
MTTVENQPQSAALAEVYDPDDVGLRDSPPLRAMKVNLTPSPSPPPAAPLPQVSPDSSPGSPGRKGSNRQKNRPSQGDAVLVSFMDGGKRPEIARKAGAEPLASDGEEEEDSVKGTEVNVPKDGVDELTALAANAMMRANEGQAAQSASQSAQEEPINKTNTPESNSHTTDGDPMEDVKPTIPSITATYIGEPREQASPDTIVKTEIKTSEGELPPILPQSPQSNLSNGHANTPITLPSISDQLGDINHLTEAAATADSPFAQSPPGRPGPPRFSAMPGQGSPPKSPHDSFRPQLPSPGRGAPPYFYNSNSIRRPSQTEGGQYSSAEYSTPSTNTETPSTDQSTPSVPIDRMSIDGITNPQIGGFQCTYPGCTAQPFQTQVGLFPRSSCSSRNSDLDKYLLNSHANVHSSNRPHYCSVKGCPRSEGGKGFKRKNEMIRHGLVHDSPGYVCPFCPDREHKYPRPDNLQR